MNKYIGNFNFDFEINYDDFKFSEHTAKDNKDNEFDLKQIELKMPTSLFKSYKEDYPDYLTEYLKKFDMEVISSWLAIQKPGYMSPPHIDEYLFLKEHGVGEVKEPGRILVFMNDWSFGQVFMVGDEVITNWKKGDAYRMDGRDLHMTSNGSYEDKLTLIMTGFLKEK